MGPTIPLPPSGMAARMQRTAVVRLRRSKAQLHRHRGARTRPAQLGRFTERLRQVVSTDDPEAKSRKPARRGGGEKVDRAQALFAGTLQESADQSAPQALGSNVVRDCDRPD